MKLRNSSKYALLFLPLLLLITAAAPSISTPNFTNIQRQLRVFSDGGTFSVFLKDGTNPANKRGICFNDNGDSTACDAGIAYDPNTASFSMTAAVIADYYRAQYVPYLSTSGPWQDGGTYALGGFNCGRPPGLTGDGLWEHGVPCITDYTGPMEITANYPDIYYDGDDICTVEITTPPNNPRAAGCNLTVMNGPQKNFWVRHDGSVWTLGNINFHQSGAHVIYVDQAPGYIELKGNIASNLGFTYASIYTDNTSTLSANSYIQSWYNGGQPQAAVDYGGAFEAHVSEATVAWDHAAAFSQYGKVGDYPAAFGASTGKEYGHKLDCPAMTDGGAGTIAYFEDAGWATCDRTGWHVVGSGTGGSVTGSTPIVVTGGTAISVINAGTNDAGVVNVGVQNFGGPKAIVFDGGSDAYALYLMKGQDMSGGTQSIGICFGGTLSDTTGVACSDPTSRQQYITAGSDTYLHILSSFRNDVSGTFTWSGAINSNGTYNTSVSSGQAFASSGTNSYSILGLSTTGGLVASSGTTNGGVTYNLDAGRLMTNTGASWRGVAYADELPASYTGSAPISVAGTVISVAAGTVSASGVTSVGDQKMTGPKAIYFDGGFALPDGGSRGANATVFPLLVSRGAASNGISSSGSAVGICLAQDATEADVTGTSCSSHYILSQGDGFMHFKSAVTNDSNGDLAWNGPIYNNNYIQSNVAGATSPSFNAIGTNAYSIPGKSTLAGLPSSSGTTTGGITFVTDAGRPYYNQGSGWYPIAGLNDLKTHEYIWTTACNSADGVSCAQADINWNPGYIPPNGDVTVGSITCGWEVDGVNSGSSPAIVEIYKTSGTPGTVCTCSFGSSSCDDGPNTPVTCNGCASNTLTNGETYVMRWNSSTTCTTKPTVMYCTVSLTNVPY